MEKIRQRDAAPRFDHEPAMISVSSYLDAYIPIAPQAPAQVCHPSSHSSRERTHLGGVAMTRALI
ncbi:hypothetical protein M378DRAFT_154661 [Amanita muscaria Koide BX008]|uniref:Uncharacterized protein n=1 Tax=Amanita muscaria (strain Koide BX008) TaxID=946122 RepID=A0A0C2T5I3_AMAMK|nr:hypothetical protein M378DRAFT_154661 [Amanita muscaria Koide BX008]